MEMKIHPSPGIDRLGARGRGMVLRRLGPASPTGGRPADAPVGSVVILGNSLTPRSIIAGIQENGSRSAIQTYVNFITLGSFHDDT
jgi:hypothetical protein